MRPSSASKLAAFGFKHTWVIVTATNDCGTLGIMVAMAARKRRARTSMRFRRTYGAVL